MTERAATIHASAVLAGATAVLIRGESGAGKSRLALELIQAAAGGAIPFARLVGDDRVHVETASGRLLVRPAAPLAGLIEIRGFGIRRLPFEPVATVGLVVDLEARAERLPPPSDSEAVIEGVRLPRLAIPPDTPAFSVILAALGRPGSAPRSGGI